MLSSVQCSAAASQVAISGCYRYFIATIIRPFLNDDARTVPNVTLLRFYLFCDEEDEEWAEKEDKWVNRVGTEITIRMRVIGI